MVTCRSGIVAMSAGAGSSCHTGPMTMTRSHDRTRSHWRVMAEVMAAVVTVVDTEDKVTAAPIHRTVEIAAVQIEVILCPGEHTQKAAVADAPA